MVSRRGQVVAELSVVSSSFIAPKSNLYRVVRNIVAAMHCDNRGRNASGGTGPDKSVTDTGSRQPQTGKKSDPWVIGHIKPVEVNFTYAR